MEEDIFYFQKLYQNNDNYNILDFKKIVEYKEDINNINLDLLKQKFIDDIDKNKNINNVSAFIDKYKIYYFDNSYEYISKFNFKKNNKLIIDYNFIKELYKIDINNIYITPKIYNNEIKILNENMFNELFKNIKLKHYKYIDLYNFYYNEFTYKNIVNLEFIFKKLKLLNLFHFYKLILKNKNFCDDDLVYYIIYNKYEIDFDKFCVKYDDIDVDKNIIKKNFYLYYIKTYNKFNIILSQNYFIKYSKILILIYLNIFMMMI